MPPELPEIVAAKRAQDRERAMHPRWSLSLGEGSGFMAGLEGLFMTGIVLIWMVIMAVVVVTFWSVAFSLLLHAGIPLGLAIIIILMASRR